MEVNALPADDNKTLAVDGGAPVRPIPLPVWPCFDEETVAAVVAVLRSGQVNYWTGPRGREFEKTFATFCGTDYAVALASGTVALEAALRSLALQPGDQVITTSRSFVATASSIVLCGGEVVFADVDPQSQNISAATMAPLITSRTRAVVAVHHAGLPCDMDPLLELAAARDLVVIEDCAQAHGARYKGRPVGGIGHIGCWSFCQDKIMTTGGEGGMVTTNSEAVWAQVWSFKDHGKNPGKALDPNPRSGFRWLHDSIGSNGRLTEMQAAIGLLQLDKLPDWHQRRTDNAQILTEGFAGLAGLVAAPVDRIYEHAWYKFYAFVQAEELAPGWNRDRIKAAIRAEGIYCDTGTCPEMYRENAFTALGMQPERRWPVARDLGHRSLFFPVHSALAAAEMADIVRAVRKVLTVAASERSVTE